MMAHIIVIEDDEATPASRAAAGGYQVEAFEQAEPALDHLRANRDVCLVVTDLMLPGTDGFGVLKGAREVSPGVGLLMITGHASVESAVDAMKRGADDYLTKPVNLDELRKRVSTILERCRLTELVDDLEKRLSEKFGRMIGRSKAMEALFRQMDLVAPARSNVLVVGESGTGKELVANALHENSPRCLRAVPAHQLRRDSGRDPGVRAVRSRARRLYRRPQPQGRQVRAGRRGHALSRRDRRAASRGAGQAAARPRAARVGRGDQADVDPDRLGAADAHELALLEHAQQLDLHLERQLADLVEEQRAAVGQLELADLARVRAGERPPLVAEQLGLQDLGRDRGAVDGQEAAWRPRASCSCSALATSSLPVPDSPTISTFERAGATRSIWRNSASIALDWPISLPNFSPSRVLQLVDPLGQAAPSRRSSRRACAARPG